MGTGFTIAIIVAGAIIAGAFAFSSAVRRELKREVRRMLRNARDAGQLPPDFDDEAIERGELSDIGVVMSSSNMRKLSLAEFVERMWFVWVPIVLVTCLGVAAILSMKS